MVEKDRNLLNSRSNAVRMIIGRLPNRTNDVHSMTSGVVEII